MSYLLFVLLHRQIQLMVPLTRVDHTCERVRIAAAPWNALQPFLAATRG